MTNKSFLTEEEKKEMKIRYVACSIMFPSAFSREDILMELAALKGAEKTLKPFITALSSDAVIDRVWRTTPKIGISHNDLEKLAILLIEEAKKEAGVEL
jgi:hypothetical protein